MLKIIHAGDGRPMSYPISPAAEFEPGMFCQLGLLGNDTVMDVSDGTAPFGIIDDVRTTAFLDTQIDEIVIISVNAIGTDANGKKINQEEVTGVLEFPSIKELSFKSDLDIILNPVNGIITVGIGTELNHDSTGNGLNDSFRIIVSYAFSVPNRPGEDSTLGSGRITVHYHRAVYATNQYDTTKEYPVNATLFVNSLGKLTTKAERTTDPGVALVTGPPSATNSTLEFLLL